MSIHSLKLFQRFVKTIGYFEILRAHNIYFCPFDQSIKEYIAFNCFFLGTSYLSSIFSPPSKYMGMGKSGYKTLKDP